MKSRSQQQWINDHRSCGRLCPLTLRYFIDGCCRIPMPCVAQAAEVLIAATPTSHLPHFLRDYSRVLSSALPTAGGNECHCSASHAVYNQPEVSSNSSCMCRADILWHVEQCTGRSLLGTVLQHTVRLTGKRNISLLAMPYQQYLVRTYSPSTPSRILS